MKIDHILFIDSGIGGLTTLSQCVKILPANYLYFADNKNAPYGNHSAEEIFGYLKNIITSLLQKYNIKIIVLACNTATTSAITKLRISFKEIVFIGTEPAVKLANKLGFDEIFCVVTPTTKKQKKFKTLTNIISSKTLLYSPKMLALRVENYYINKTVVNLYKLNKELFLLAHKSKNTPCIVLGCTHYVFVKEYLNKLTHKTIIDGNRGVSKQVQSIYEKLNLSPAHKSTIIFFVSNPAICSKEIYKKIFTEILAKV